MPIQKPGQLPPAASSFAKYQLTGFNLADAYRKAFPCAGLSANRIAERASRLAAKPAFKAMLSSMIDELRLQDLESVGRFYKQLDSDMAAAREAANHTALAQYNRLKASILGLVKSEMAVTFESKLSDDALVKSIAGENPELAAALRKSLGNVDGFGGGQSAKGETTH